MAKTRTRSTTSSLLLAAIALSAPSAAIAAQRIKAAKGDPERATRRSAVRDLAERASASALGPQRGAAGLSNAAAAAGIAWKLDPSLGRAMFDRVLDRSETLLASEGDGEMALAALPAVLSELASCDSGAAEKAIERLASSGGQSARPEIRSRLFGVLASTVGVSDPAASERLIVKSFGETGFEPRSWGAIRELDSDAASRAIEAGLGSLERGSPSIANLFAAATFSRILVFGTPVDMDVNGTPANVRRWLVVSVGRLEMIRVALIASRASGAPPAVAQDELPMARFLAPSIVSACERWFPEGVQTARVAANEIGLNATDGSPGGGSGARPPLDADTGRIDRAYELARSGEAKEARAAIVDMRSDEARAAVADEIELILAAGALRASRWTDLEQRLAGVVDRALRVHALGAAAIAVQDAGSSDVAERLAAEAVRIAAKDGVGIPVAAGLARAAIVFDRNGDGPRSRDALKASITALSRMETAPAAGSSCRCWPFVPVAFGAITVSTGLRVGMADVPLDEAFSRAAKRDVIGSVYLATSAESASTRETAELALARALLVLGI